MNIFSAQIEAILNSFGDIFLKAAKLYAAKYINTKTGKDTLSDSDIMRNLKVEVNEERLVISVSDYYRYIESGRKVGAKGIPLSVLVKWIKEKNIKPNGNISINSLAFLIQRSIKKTGISKRPFLTMAYKEAGKELEKQINEMIDDVMKDTLIKFVKNKV